MQNPQTLEMLLENHPFLLGLRPEFYDFLAGIGTVRRFAAHQQIFQEDWPADHFYLILAGNVGLETIIPGRGHVWVQTLGPGDALGWSWLFPPYQWQFTANTLATTEVIAFDAAALRNKADQSREFRNELMARITKSLADRIHALRQYGAVFPQKVV